ncbi:hypothetical protein G6F62_013615 [Rhizopus arrhizus]|nr:hypothetical protein G6F62_013615 [Rhizopus arrhizus]
MHPACQESPHLKDLPPDVAARESRCNKGMEVWSSEGKGSDKPLDLSGKKKELSADGRRPEPALQRVSQSGRVGARIAGPGDDAIGAHHNRAQARRLIRHRSHADRVRWCIAHDVARQRFHIEHEQRPLPGPQQLAGATAVGQHEVRHAATDQRVPIAQRQLLRHPPDPFGQIGRAIAGVGQIGHHRRQCA